MPNFIFYCNVSKTANCLFQEISGNIRLRDENGREMDALQVFGYSIQYLKNHLLSVVSQSSPDLQEGDIRWVITVPAIWADSAKKFMRQAAQQVIIVTFYFGIILQ